jgi:hypothetical protein
VERVEWLRGNALEPQTYQAALQGALGAVSAVGAFGSQEYMMQVGHVAREGRALN